MKNTSASAFEWKKREKKKEKKRKKNSNYRPRTEVAGAKDYDRRSISLNGPVKRFPSAAAISQDPRGRLIDHFEP